MRAFSFLIGGFFFPAASLFFSLISRSHTKKQHHQLQSLLQVVAEDKKIIEAKLGKRETKEILKEVALLEKKVASLEKRADGAVGAETPELDAAAKPLLARIEELRNIVGLVDDNAVEAR